MKIGLGIGNSGARMELPLDLILRAERLGFNSVWASETYGSDAITPLAFIAGDEAHQARNGHRPACRAHARESLVGDPARANMLSALMTGRALTTANWRMRGGHQPRPRARTWRNSRPAA